MNFLPEGQKLFSLSADKPFPVFGVNFRNFFFTFDIRPVNFINTAAAEVIASIAVAAGRKRRTDDCFPFFPFLSDLIKRNFVSIFPEKINFYP